MRLPETTGDSSGDPMRARGSELPSKLFFRIGEVASLVGVEPHVLRYWEREFRSIRPTKSAKGQRVYSRKDVENLLRVRDLLYRDGFTIAGAKKRLQRAPAPSDRGVTGLAAQASLFAEPEPEPGPEPERDEPEPAADFSTDVGCDASADAGGATEVDVEGSEAHAHSHAHDDDDDDLDDLDLSTADPESGPRASGTDPMRAKLTALRTEVEGFLHDLESDRGERIEPA